MCGIGCSLTCAASGTTTDAATNTARTAEVSFICINSRVFYSATLYSLRQPDVQSHRIAPIAIGAARWMPSRRSCVAYHFTAEALPPRMSGNATQERLDG